MGGFPNFPVDGTILSTSVTSDRVSLVENKIGNLYYPKGQYIFYTKNNSIWYKFKTNSQNWSNEILWIGSATSSNTKFDANGYPMTTYIALDGSINLNYFDSNGNFSNNSIALTGNLPTIAINNLEIYLFWVPLNFTNFIFYTEIKSNFSIIRSYKVPAPGQIYAMQIELTNDNRFLFTFEIRSGSNQKVYVAFTDIASMHYSYDLISYVNFVS